MAWDRPTLTELVSRISGDIEQRVTGSDKLLRRSLLKIFSIVIAGAIHLTYSFLTYMAENLFAATADIDGLQSIGSEYGLTQNGSVQAEGEADIVGTNGYDVTAGTELQDSGGVLFTVQSTVTIASGVATLSLIANEGGEDGNKDEGAILTFLTQPDGVTGNATVNATEITGGADEETTEEFRQRILRRKQNPPYGGIETDYENWMLEYTNVSRAWAFPAYQGAGTVACVFVNDDDDPITPDSTFRDNVRAYLVSHEDEATGRTIGIPVTAENGLMMLESSELDVDIEVNTSPNTSTTQSEIEAELNAMILREGGPNETIYLSDIYNALSRVQSITQFEVVSPVASVYADYDEVHVLGNITYGSL